MGRCYSANGFCTAGVDKTAIEIVTTAALRVKIYELLIGCAAAPASQAALWHLQRLSASGTGTAFTPVKVDAGDTVSLCPVEINHSAEPTYTAGDIPWAMALNQQATFNWKANPGREIVLAASATAGIGLKSSTSTGTAVHSATIWWDE